MAGLALLALAAALFVAELHTPGAGILGVLGLAAFVLGAFFLGVSPWIIAVGVAALVGLFALLLPAVFRASRRLVTTGVDGLVGRTGTASSELLPDGTVKVDGEAWTARAMAGPIHTGEQVRVIGVEGVTLQVNREAAP